MEKTTIYLIRHGEIENPRQVMYGSSLDLSLSEEGKQQIQALAQGLKLEGVKINRIYTSPLARALKSASLLAEILDQPPIFKENDLTDVGILALVGHQLAEREEIHARGTDEYSEEFVKKGNESRGQITERMLKAFERIYRENIGKTVLLVSHGDSLRFLLFRLQNPEGQIPSMSELKKTSYPKKGEGWKMSLNKKGRILEITVITREGMVKVEKGTLI